MLPLKKSPVREEDKKTVRVLLPINIGKVPNISSLIPFDSNYKKQRRNYVHKSLRLGEDMWKPSNSPRKEMDFVLAKKIAKIEYDDKMRHFRIH